MIETERSIGIGMVGAGMIGQLAHLSNFAEIPGCHVTALAELRSDLGRQVADKFGVPKLYPDHRAMLDDPMVEAVIVVTRRPATGPVALDCLNGGRHVLSEKPMAHSMAQAKRLVTAAQARDLRYAIGFMKRHDAGTALAHQLVQNFRDSGEMGRVLLMRSWCYTGEFACNSKGFIMTGETRPDGITLWPVAPDWVPPDRHEDYAWFLNVFIHDINLLRHLAGGTPRVRSVDLDRCNGRLVTFDCGDFPAILEMAEVNSAHWSEGVEVVFEKGRLVLSLASPLLRVPAAVTLHRSNGEVVAFQPDWSWSFRRQAEAFVADIRSKREPLASGADSVADIQLVEDIWRRHLGHA
ncbi:MAG: Gfo/Idh/MocA family oxidoreductase [Phaeospirillum sp.]|nr:Gfo/Idh/MocA family oxidoreductase [Phaeospirillum sp.]